MDFPDLNFIQSDIDPATVKPIEGRELIRLINGFLLTSADIVDTFCAAFEQRILALESRMDSFEKQLVLLEHRLSNIPTRIQATMAAEHKSAADSADHEQLLTTSLERRMDDQQQQQQTSSSSVDAIKLSSSNATTLTATKQIENEQMENDTEKRLDNDDGTVQAKEHPTYGKYFRMLRMGVPEPAVKQKMRSEGIDPTILDNPNLLLPAVNRPKVHSENSSDDDDTAHEEHLSTSVSSSSSSSSFA